MIQEGDRRSEPRREFHDPAQTFHEGHRFEAAPEDISVGGMFLKTDAVDDVRAGEVLGVLLEREAGFDPPLFLYGRVVRVRHSGTPGVGLRWERAGSTGSVEQLANALELLFAKPASAFRPHVTQVPNSRLQSAYEFPRPAPEPGVPEGVGPVGAGRATSRFQGNAAAVPPGPLGAGRATGRFPGEPPHEPRAPLGAGRSTSRFQGDAPAVAAAPAGAGRATDRFRGDALPPLGRPNSGPIGLAVTDDELDRLNVKVVHDSQSRQGRNFKRAFDVDAGIVEATPTATGGPAPVDDVGVPRGAFEDDEPTRVASIPRSNHADRRAVVHLDAVMRVAHVEVPVVVTGLAMGSLFAETLLAPLGRSTRITVRLDVPHRDGIGSIWLDCALERLHEGDYGTPPGVELKIVSFEAPEQREELARLLDQARPGRR